MEFELLIVVPCYNEAQRLKSEKFIEFAFNNKDTAILFCNDGSTDDTMARLFDIQESCSENIFILDSKENFGKAGIIRKGVQYSFSENLSFKKIAYLDADLSTSLEECQEVSRYVRGEVALAFGSRISKIDNEIRRKLYRHLIGRVVATFISGALRIKVYDTQCGCKVFGREIAQDVFRDKFISRWLFDVEIFYRLIRIFGRAGMRQVCREIPLQKWVDTDHSKVSFLYGFRLWYDLFIIYRKYNDAQP